MTSIVLVGRIDAPGREPIQMGRVELDSTELLTTSLSGCGSEHTISNSKRRSSCTTCLTGWNGALRNVNAQCIATIAANIVLQRDETTMSIVTDGCAFSQLMECTLISGFLTSSFSDSPTFHESTQRVQRMDDS